MSIDGEYLLDRLPAIYRLRDAERAAALGDLLTSDETTELAALEALASPTAKQQDRIDELRKKALRGPLGTLLCVFAEQLAVVEDNLEQLYDDLFIETCADWVVPYIGDLIGYQSLHGTVPSVASPRAEVAHTIALRRRKGTATALEQVARDVTGWPARAVEFFQLLSTTQYVNHLRLHNKAWADVRDSSHAETMEWIGTAFDKVPRTVEVRRIESGGGRYNVPNVGIFLWRIGAYPRTLCPAHLVQAGQYRVSPLNHDLPLYSPPCAEEEITHIAEPFNVPLRLSRRYLDRHLSRYYGEQADGAPCSLALQVDGVDITYDKVDICDLSGADGSWAHVPRPAGRYAIDPALGRVAAPPEVSTSAKVLVTWHEGFSADIGGGEYERADSFAEPATGQKLVYVPKLANVLESYSTITSALGAISGNGVIVIQDNAVYSENLAIDVAAKGTVEIRADDGYRPTLVLSSPMTITGAEEGRFVLNGLLVTGDALTVPDAGNALAGLELQHCTLVPGLALTTDGRPKSPNKPSLVVDITGLTVKIDHSIVGAVRCHARSGVRAFDSVIDATDMERVAFAGPDGVAAGGKLHLEACTVVGKIHARQFGTVTDSILLAAVAAGDADWPAPVRTERRQVGCVRFSFLPFDSLVCKRYRCQPDSAQTARQIAPGFESLRYGTPEYCQLTVSTPDAVRRGAEDESEMGVFHQLYGPQRETNLRVRLKEYLRVGLEAGIFYES